MKLRKRTLIASKDINHSGDGMLHGNLLQNNGFQGDSPGLTAWTAIGTANISQDTTSPLTDAITSTLAISGSIGTIGASNAGYDGIRGSVASIASRGSSANSRSHCRSISKLLLG